MTNHIVVTRPGFEISTRSRHGRRTRNESSIYGSVIIVGELDEPGTRIYITDAVRIDISASEIREDIREDDRLDNEDDVPEEVAKYIEKYELYK